MAAYQPDGRNRVVRRQSELARQLAVEGRWQDAVALNRQILETFPRDVNALNRLGKALTELGQVDEAITMYRAAVEIDPTNVIAQRNVARLERVVGAAITTEPGPATPIRASVFIEQVGKTYITDLQHPGAPEVLAFLAPADQLEIRRDGRQIVVYDQRGERIGQVEPEIAQLLGRLLDAGNRYDTYVVALSGNTVRVILREVFRNPESPLPLGFPRQATIAAPRPYLRDSRRMAHELEPDLLLDSDEDEEDESDEEEIDEIDAVDAEREDEDDYVDEADNEDDESDSPLAQ